MITRWTDIGILESKGDFKIADNLEFGSQAPFNFSYPSTSQIVVIIQYEKEIRFVKIEDDLA